MGSDNDTLPPPPDRRNPRRRLGSQPVIEEVDLPALQRGKDDPRLVRELERLESARAEALARAQDAYEQAQVARQNAEIARAAAHRVATDRPTKSQWASLAYKLVGSLTALVVAATVALGAWTSQQSSRIDKTQERQQTQDNATGTLEARVRELEDFQAKLLEWVDCGNAERDSAIERGTGHIVDGKHDDVLWVEQNKPPTRVKIPWESAPWSIAKSEACPPRPIPPRRRR